MSRAKRKHNALQVKVMMSGCAICEFMIITSHPNLWAATLRWIHTKLVTFHPTKRIFQPFRQSPARRMLLLKVLDELVGRRHEAGRPITLSQTLTARCVLEQKVNKFSFIKMLLPIHIPDCIRQMSFLNNFSIDIFELLLVESIKTASRALN